MMMSGGLGVVWLGKVGMWRADTMMRTDLSSTGTSNDIHCPNG